MAEWASIGVAPPSDSTRCRLHMVVKYRSFNGLFAPGTLSEFSFGSFTLHQQMLCETSDLKNLAWMVGERKGEREECGGKKRRNRKEEEGGGRRRKRRREEEGGERGKVEDGEGGETGRWRRGEGKREREWWRRMEKGGGRSRRIGGRIIHAGQVDSSYLGTELAWL